MKEFVSSVSPKGQVTIPAEVRKRFGIKPRDKVTFYVDGDDVRLRPTSFTLETAAGSVPALKEPLDWKEVERRAKDEHVQQSVGNRSR
jgi:AbrB family looped-hinge helix DNA binding protein